jgi:hypothetical protein
MSAERDELERLVRELPDEAVPRALEDMRRHLRSVQDRPWPPAWFGAAPGRRPDTSERIDELLSAEFGK